MSIKQLSANKVAGGWHKRYVHTSKKLQCDMEFAIFLPPQAEEGPVPTLYWLSGLTCNDTNFMQKAGAHKMAASLGIAIVAPDTSPRGESVPDDPDKSYDFGLGAGFYINATQPPWDTHYKMYDYVLKELPEVVEGNFPLSEQRAISGHSMGGHGALTLALHHPERFSSVSAFSPICNPSNCPWGEKAFSGYLGTNREQWEHHDASILMAKATQKIPALVDQGLADEFLDNQLKPQTLQAASRQNNYPLDINYHEGYDHSYFFISSFIDKHLQFHASHFTTT